MHRNEPSPEMGANELTQKTFQFRDISLKKSSNDSKKVPESGNNLQIFEENPVFIVSDSDKFLESAHPWSLQCAPRSSFRRCTCQCICGSTTGFKIKDNVKSLEDSKANDSSWRLLHMCRAKLKGSTTTSQLLAGFAMKTVARKWQSPDDSLVERSLVVQVSLVNMTIHSPTQVPEWLFVVFTVTNTSLVVVHIFALMISTYILPNIDAIFKIRHKDLVTEAPHERMRRFIDVAWTFSTVLGLFLFLVQVAVVCWIQLLDFSFTAALVGSLIVGPVLIIFIVVIVHFYKHLMV